VVRSALLASSIAFAAAAQGGSVSAQQPGAPAQQPGASAQQPGASAQPPGPPAANAMTLERTIQIALERNYDLRRTQYQALSSGQDLIIARAAILPRLDFNGSISEFRFNGQQFSSNGVPIPGATTTSYSTQYAAGLRLQQLIFDGGKWWNNLAAADLNLASSDANVDEQRLTTVYTVEQKFYELIRAQRQLKVLGDAAVRSRDQADFTQRLFEGGRATQADVYAARANRDNDEINRLGQEAKVELARQDLAVTIGVDPAEPLAIAEPAAMQEDPSAPPPAGQAVQKALAQRPSLKAFALTAEAQRKTAAAAKGDYWPSVSIGGSYSRNNPDFAVFSDPMLNKNSTISGSVNLTWNVFNGLATKAAVEKGQISVLLAENDLENGRRGVASDVEKAIAQLGVARQQARIASQTLVNANENLRLARTRQQVGVGTQLEVRDAELKLTQSELARANALVDGHEAESALRRATGG
jgi:outer membrane protein